VGWLGDIPLTTDGSDREGIQVPIAKNADGSPITGPVWNRFANVSGNTQSLAGTIGRTPLILAVFTWRVFAISAAVALFAGSWLRGLTKRLWIRAITVLQKLSAACVGCCSVRRCFSDCTGREMRLSLVTRRRKEYTTTFRT
jgi:hypothetical protein